ncbi:MAG: FAD-binding oxidoreductase [Acidimicrobiia bacterium]|nr:FAD-binding oxidoreductase [Acidimicrobiia bacterium]
MRTRYGTSPWTSEFPASRRPAFPRFRSDRPATVVIVGAGLTGSAIAYACAAAGMEPVVLEAERIGSGTSGRSVGLLNTGPGPLFRDVAAAHGLRAARRVFETWRRGALDGAALLRRLNITCDLGPAAGVLAAPREDEKALRREYDARSEAGLDDAWLNAKQLQGAMKLSAAAALRTRDGFTVDPYRAAVGLASAAVERGAAVFEQSRVKKVGFTRKYADVITDGGTIRTTAVVVATGSATPEWRSLRRHFKRRELYAVMTEPLGAAMREQLFDSRMTLRDTRVPAHRVRWARDGRLLVAGGDQDETPARTREAVLVQRTGQLMYELLTMYPAISGLHPQYGWEASYGETADGLMYIGPHRNFPHHHFALGGGRDTVTGAFVAARLIVRAIQRTSEKGDDVFGWNR